MFGDRIYLLKKQGTHCIPSTICNSSSFEAFASFVSTGGSGELQTLAFYILTALPIIQSSSLKGPRDHLPLVVKTSFHSDFLPQTNPCRKGLVSRAGVPM